MKTTGLKSIYLPFIISVLHFKTRMGLFPLENFIVQISVTARAYMLPSEIICQMYKYSFKRKVSIYYDLLSVLCV